METHNIPYPRDPNRRAAGRDGHLKISVPVQYQEWGEREGKSNKIHPWNGTAMLSQHPYWIFMLDKVPWHPCHDVITKDIL